MRRRDSDVLAERAGPPGRVAPGEAGEHAAAGEVVEHRQVFGQLNRVDGGQVHAELADAHPLRVLGDEVVPEQRIRRRLDPLHLQVLLGQILHM